MNYDLSETQSEKSTAFQDFCREEAAGVADRLTSGAGPAALLPDFFRRLGEVGYFGLCMPEALGGQDEELVLQVTFDVALAEVDRALFLAAYTSGVHCARLLARFGTDAQKERFLRPLLTGEAVAAIGRTESGGGFDLDGMDARARRDGDGWRLHARKSFCVNAGIADLFVVFARTGDDEEKPGALGCFVIPQETSGVTVGEPLEMLGYTGLPLAPVVFENVRVEADQVLGGEEAGQQVLEASWLLDSLGTASASVAIIQACLDLSFAHAGARESFGKPILKYQEVSFKIADMRAMLDTARLLLQKAAWLWQEGDAEAGVFVSAAKLFAAEAAVKCAGMAVQVHGAGGLLKGSPVARLYRDAKACEIGGGTSEMHRLGLAKAVLEAF